MRQTTLPDHKIIFLNGPPSSGKDTGARILYRNLSQTRLFKMSTPLKRALAAFFTVNRKDVEQHKDNKQMPVIKTTSGEGFTWREVQISLSEEWAKKKFGIDIFGQLAIQALLNDGTTCRRTVISDSGFTSEALPIIAAFGAENCLLIRLSREGCTFENDSRSYIELEEHGVTAVDLVNMFPLERTKDMPVTYEMQMLQVVRQWLGMEEPDDTC